MPSVVTDQHIERAIAALPLQGRVMLRLLLLQYLDPTQDEIEYIAVDRPDPRRQAGVLPTAAFSQLTQDNLKGITDRIEQYRYHLRRRRERLALQTDCLTRQIALSEASCQAAERLLLSRFGLVPDAVAHLKVSARTAVLRAVVRELERKWESDEVSEEDYLKARLSVEYQLFLRRQERDRRRLEQTRRENDLVSQAPLQDHELAHIWGLPVGTLMARKVKYVHLYLQGLQSQLREAGIAEASTAPLDLWKETFRVLASRRVERAAAEYDGLERTEAQLLDKITALANATMPEEVESRFWQSITQDTKHAAEVGSTLPSLFALQRYSALLAEMDTSLMAVEQELLGHVSPRPKVVAALPEAEPTSPDLGQMGEHVLRSFTGDDHSDTRGGKR